MPVITLREMEDELTRFWCDRLEIRRAADRDKLEALDRDLVRWFADQGIDLVIDRDPVTQEPIEVTVPAKRGPVLAPKVAADVRGDATYSLEVTFTETGGPHFSVTYSDRDIADRAYLAVCNGMCRFASARLVRHTGQASQIVQSFRSDDR